jgi:hypothetical protein
VPLFDESPYRGARRVIDISGDGPNNSGEPVAGARDAALAKGITINGLPIMLKEPSPRKDDIEDLDLYYEDCVIGGPDAFVTRSRIAKNSRKRSGPCLFLKLRAARLSTGSFRPPKQSRGFPV